MSIGLERLAEGDLFQGRYRVVRPIGAGGVGALYEVLDERTSGRRALKVLSQSALFSDDLRARFLREGKLTGAIESEHVVRVLDAGAPDETPYIVMELLTGEDLEAKLTREGRLSPSLALTLLEQAAHGLARTHQAGLVHRDIKPENLFLTQRDDGSPCLKLVDFGLAKISAPKGAPTTRVIGTPLYMAPEQVRGDGDVSPRADLYALAHVGYTLLVGEPYFAEEIAQGVLRLMIHVTSGASEPASARAARRRQVALPAGFDAWFARATALEPAARFGSARELIDALRALLAASPAATARAEVAALAPTERAPRQAPPVASAQATLASHARPQLGGVSAALAPTARSPIAAPPPPPPARLSRPRARLWPLAAGLAGLLLLVALALWLLGRDGSPPEPGPRTARAPSASGAPPSSAPGTSPVFTSHPPSCALPDCAPFEPQDPARVTSAEVLRIFERIARDVDPTARLQLFGTSMHFGAAGIDTTAAGATQAMFATSSGRLHMFLNSGLVRLSRPPEAAAAPVAAPFGACTLERAVQLAEREGVVFEHGDTSNAAFYTQIMPDQSAWSLQRGEHVFTIVAPSCQLTAHDVARSP